MASPVGVRIRLAVDGDVGYVIKTWRETYARESFWSRRMPRQVYHPYHRKLIENLVAHTNVVVACNEKDPTHLVGFICGERIHDTLLVHFVSVRFEFRRFGVAKALLAALEHRQDEPIVVTHWTYDCDRLPESYRIVYNPYVLFKQFREQLDDRRATEPAGDLAGAEGRRS